MQAYKNFSIFQKLMMNEMKEIFITIHGIHIVDLRVIRFKKINLKYM